MYIDSEIAWLYIDVLYFNRSIRQEDDIIATKRYFIDGYDSIHYFSIDYENNKIYYVKSERKKKERQSEY